MARIVNGVPSGGCADLWMAFAAPAQQKVAAKKLCAGSSLPTLITDTVLQNCPAANALVTSPRHGRAILVCRRTFDHLSQHHGNRNRPASLKLCPVERAVAIQTRAADLRSQQVPDYFRRTNLSVYRSGSALRCIKRCWPRGRRVTELPRIAPVQLPISCHPRDYGAVSRSACSSARTTA
jgi:hypothetical protein